MNNKNYLFDSINLFASTFFSFVFSIILARFLGPTIHGQVAFILSFMVFFEIISNYGLNYGFLIKKEAYLHDYGTIFYTNLILSLTFYLLFSIISIFFSRIIAFTNIQILIQVLGLRIILHSTVTTQITYLKKKFRFKLQMYTSLFSIILTGSTSVILAINNLGIWSLVFYYLLEPFINIIIYSIYIGPFKFSINLQSLLKIFHSSWRITLSSLYDTFFVQISSIIIGVYFSIVNLGYYNKAKQLPEILNKVILNSISNVSFSELVLNQFNLSYLTQKTRNLIRYSSFFVFPTLMGLIVTGQNLLFILLGEEWLPSYVYLVFISIGLITWPMQVFNQNTIKLLGNGKYYLKIVFLRKVFYLVTLLLVIPLGLDGIFISLLISEFFSLVVVSVYSKKLLNYSFLNQLIDVFPIFLSSITMAIIVNIFSFIDLNLYIVFPLQIFIGIFIYLVTSFFLSKELLGLFISYLLGLFKKTSTF